MNSTKTKKRGRRGAPRKKAAMDLHSATPINGQMSDPRRKNYTTFISGNYNFVMTPTSSTDGGVFDCVFTGTGFFGSSAQVSAEVDEFRIKRVTLTALACDPTKTYGATVFVVPNLDPAIPVNTDALLHMVGVKAYSMSQPQFEGPIKVHSVTPRVALSGADAGIGIDTPWCSVISGADRLWRGFVVGVRGYGFTVGQAITVPVILTAEMEYRGFQ